MIDKIKDFQESKRYAKVYRKVAEDKVELSSGYILDFSDNFILLQECDDFKAAGYAILPVAQIERLRFNKADRYYDKIVKWEKEIEKVKIPFEVNLSSLQSVFKSLKSNNTNVIIECEHPDIDSFTIGPIIKIGKKYVYILYFDAQGFWDEDTTSIDFNSITKITFDNQYINTISKYTRHKKVKP